MRPFRSAVCIPRVLCIVCVLRTNNASAQTRVGAEVARDRLTYHFSNLSSADTPFLVPHFFEQRYIADNVWLVGSAEYTKGVRWETSGGVTPQRTTTADDYDTFFDPDGTVIVSGTTGDATVRAVRFSQRAEIATIGRLRILTSYRFRQDSASFHLGHKTVTRNGALVEAVDVTSPETTRSQEHGIFGGVETTWQVGDSSTLSLAADLTPIQLARLVVQLPDKYPGRNLVFTAKTAAGFLRLALEYRRGAWALAISAEAGATWSYRDAARLEHGHRSAQASVGRRW